MSKPLNAKKAIVRARRRMLDRKHPWVKSYPLNHMLRRDHLEINPDPKLYPNMLHFQLIRRGYRWIWIPLLKGRKA